MVLASLNVCSFAAQFRVGDKIDVKEDSMWFLDETSLMVWQRFAKVATPEVLESYRDVVLGSRAAWQFGLVQSAKILTYYPDEHQVQVKMLLQTPGKWQNGSIWWLDDRDIVDNGTSTPATSRVPDVQDKGEPKGAHEDTIMRFSSDEAALKAADHKLNQIWSSISAKRQAELRPAQRKWLQSLQT